MYILEEVVEPVLIRKLLKGEPLYKILSKVYNSGVCK